MKPYWQLIYHLVWATQNRRQLLTSQVEPIIYGHQHQKAVGLGAVVFALNGAADHVHMVVSIPPKIAVAKFVGQVKAVASARYNKSEAGRKDPFFWQEEYVAFSFDRKRLSNYAGYVERQKVHHAERTTIPISERMEFNSGPELREPALVHHVEDADWRSELEQRLESDPSVDLSQVSRSRRLIAGLQKQHPINGVVTGFIRCQCVTPGTHFRAFSFLHLTYVKSSPKNLIFLDLN